VLDEDDGRTTSLRGGLDESGQDEAEYALLYACPGHRQFLG